MGNETIYFKVIKSKGDWDFARKAFNLCRWWGARRTCHLCLASLRGDLNFRDLSSRAPWRDTAAGAPLPWHATGPYLTFPNMTPSSISIDLMHTWHLGVGRDMVASSIMTLQEMGVDLRREKSARIAERERERITEYHIIIE